MTMESQQLTQPAPEQVFRMKIRYTLNEFKKYVSAVLGLAFCWLVFGVNVATAQNYRLQPGDTLKAEIIQLSDVSWNSTIDFNGKVRFPYLGQFIAAGRTIDELTTTIAQSSAGLHLAVRDHAQATSFFLDESSVFLTVERYRPVTILGAVTTPGRIEYSPDLTIRSAIGAVGGTFTGQAMSQAESARLAATLTELQTTEAWLMMEAWRLQGQLNPEFITQPPQAFRHKIQTFMSQSDIDDVRSELSENQVTRNLRRQAINDNIHLNKKRLAFLEKSLDQYKILSTEEDDRLSAMISLKSKGLAAQNSITLARTGVLSASSRLLDAEANVAKVTIELTSLEQQRASFDTDMRLKLQPELGRIKRSLDEVQAQIKGIELEQLLTHRAGGAGDASALRVLIHRTQGQVTEHLPAKLDDPVQPGDVIEVSLDLAG